MENKNDPKVTENIREMEKKLLAIHLLCTAAQIDVDVPTK